MEPKTVLTNWRSLNDALAKATEQQCSALLDAEKKGDNRPTFLMRIYGKFSVLRANRERQELLGG